MSTWYEGDKVPHGEQSVTHGEGWMPGENEITECEYCSKPLLVDYSTDDAGHTIVSYGDLDHISHGGLKCCSQSCTVLADLDIRAELQRLIRNFKGLLFANLELLEYVEKMLRNHSYALEPKGHDVLSILKEAL
jgi:hypothetical protein